MARPRKEGLDYFPHDVDASIDEKLEALEALHGVEGYAFYFKLLERIYRAGGYWRVSDAETRQIFGVKRMHWAAETAHERFTNLLETCLKWGLFDPEVYQDRGELTSEGILARVMPVEKKRVNSTIKRFQARSCDRNPTQTPESKVKESKVKESKVKERKEEENTRAPSDLKQILKQEFEKEVDEPLAEAAKTDEYLAKALPHFDPPADQDWTRTSAFMNVGRRPLKKYPELWLTPYELAEVFRLWDGKIPVSEFRRGFQIALTKVRGHVQQGKNPENIQVASWLMGWVYKELLEAITQETRLEQQRAR